jgi:hypothetical protein
LVLPINFILPNGKALVKLEFAYFKRFLTAFFAVQKRTVFRSDGLKTSRDKFPGGFFVF